MKMKLNVYPMIADMEERLKEIIQEAVDSRAKVLEIAYGPASESIKKRILNFLIKKEIRKLYSRFEKTEKGWGRIYVYFRR
jgi:bifunctional pyridoxal-dependent enzyme with beta-cystathionase and maltose regulon repressor activities